MKTKQAMAYTTIFLLTTLVLVTCVLVEISYALPTGATVTNITTVGAPTRTAGNRTDPRGTFTTLSLDVVQQDQYWKAYVGNITGRLSLDNPAGQSIYEWALSAVNKSGKVFVSRSNTVDFENVTCANVGNVTTEHLYYNMTDTQSDSINLTFNSSNHASFYVGTLFFNTNACAKSMATYISDAPQTINGNQKFQEVVLQDSSNRMVYMTVLSSAAGYDGVTYDFQMIVPESGIRVTSTTYYFYTELNG